MNNYVLRTIAIILLCNTITTFAVSTRKMIKNLHDREVCDKKKHSKISLSGCRLKSIHGIEMLGNISHLDISDNNIKDLAPLESLTHLMLLRAQNNKIRNTKPLITISSLRAIDLSKNIINNAHCTLLLQKRNLEELIIKDNPITTHGYQTYIQQDDVNFIAFKKRNRFCELSKATKDVECGICQLSKEDLEPNVELYATPCNHAFCEVCLTGLYSTQKKSTSTPPCPNCRQKLPECP